ncbi:hypothetical protein ACFC0M_16480 [Streptomyces sp. NPDC056149]|uniref:hypothetical protein n=1 Tax=Streptomyces sp. NPDC056149 TaxID=3345728 RepID=UPI0035DC590E
MQTSGGDDMTAEETADWVALDLDVAPDLGVAVRDVLAPAVEQLAMAGAAHRFVYQKVGTAGRLRTWFHVTEPGAGEAVRHQLHRRLTAPGQALLNPPPDRQRPPVLVSGPPPVVRWQEQHLASASAVAVRMLLDGPDAAERDTEVLSFLLANRAHELRRPADLRARSEALVAAGNLAGVLESAELTEEFAAGRQEFVTLLRGIWMLPRGWDGAATHPYQCVPGAPPPREEEFWALGGWMDATHPLLAKLTSAVRAAQLPASGAAEVQLLRVLDEYTALMGNRLGVPGRRHRMLLALAAASVRALVPSPKTGDPDR